MSGDKVDDYWLKMAALAVEALGQTLRPDLTPRRREIVAEYLGGIFDNAYKMGIRLGEMRAKVDHEERK